MQRILSRILLLLFIFISGSIFAETQANAPRKGVIRVKLQPEVAAQLGAKPLIKTNGVAISSGVKALDLAAKKVNAMSIKRVFPYNEKFEAQRAKYGLDRWYEISFDESINPLEAKSIFKSTSGVQIAENVVPMVLKEGSNDFRVLKSGTQVTSGTTSLPMNDPRLSLQWHYHNDGSINGSAAGADINLFEAWKVTTGKSNVIVAIIDGGIDITHEDLVQNLCINEAEKNGTAGVDDDGNGYIDDVYGFNFCTNSAEIYPHSHGTHVAGTVAAVNNNGIGVCGVAGGDGTPESGVKLISCQIFDSRSGVGEADYAKALVYAAERGASIAQCSWGWSSPNYYEQAVLDAIDYFTNTSRSDVMTGGLCIFASGNEGSGELYYPAAYEPTLCVAAMTCDYSFAPYSNYGSYVDVTAPGGLLDYNEAQGVLSTLPGNSYGYSEGTSMATPHVSGIAALALSHFGKSDLLNETLRQQIIASVNDFYAHNPGYEGEYGSGYVDAAKALETSDGTAPDAVTSFSALPAQDNITIEWNIPNSSTGSVNHHILYYSTTEFTAESDLTNVKTVAIDTKFMASGDLCTYELTGLSATTTYYLALKAVDRWGNASALSPVVAATTNAGPKMSVDKTSLSITVKSPATTGSAVFNISNLDEGLLKWSAYTRTTKATISTRSTGKEANPGLVTKYNGKIGMQLHSANPVFNATDYLTADYPKEFSYYTSLYAYIGDSDASKPNSMAQWFKVDASEYPDGFNLSHIRLEGTSGQNPTFQIYDGSGSISASSLIQEFKPSYFYYNGNMQLTEQLYFAPGESFWIVVHFEPQEELYPLGLATAKQESYGAYSYMSNDLGQSWTPLATALAGSRYESLGENVSWAITAVSQNPDWSSLMTLTPSEGTVKYQETQEVTIANDGQPIINGTYKFNLRFKTNETETNTTVIPVTLTVSGNAPKMADTKIVNFGDLLVGETKTLTIEVFNEGYGPFGYYGQISGRNISSSSEHFVAPSYISGGFPARSSKTFDVKFAPKSAGSHTGNITFTHSDGTEFKITVYGVATDPAKIVVEPDTIEVGELVVDAAPVEQSFTISNAGNYPLEYVFPKFSDAQLENSTSAAHKFGYTYLSNLNGATEFEYDGNPELIGATDVTSKFNDNTYLTEAVSLGFNFPFYGKTYDKVYISSYGGVAFGIGEYAYRSPLSESAYGLEGVGYISAYGYQLAIGPDSKIEYAKQDGKFVIKYTNVLGLVYDQDYTPISFHITLSANGDVELFYDSYEPYSLFEEGTTLFAGIKDEADSDAFVVTSVNIANRYNSNPTPEGELYSAFTSGTAVKIVAPKANFVTSLTPAYGIVNPGENVTINATLAANNDMIAGDTFNRLVLLSNDPLQSTSYVRFNAVIKGENLKPVASLESTEIDFGQVFRTSDAKLPVTVKNEGKDSLTVESVALANGAFTFVATTPFKIPAGLSKDIIVTLPTDNEGAVADVMTITTDAGVLTANIKGEVIGCPGIELSYNEITETVESGTPIDKPLTITNNGDEPLVYSINPNSMVKFNDAVTETSKVSYSYASSTEDSSVEFNWIDIETTGLGTQNNFTYYNSHDYVEVELPFAFPFYGKTYTKMYIYNTGFVSFTKRNDDKIWPEPPAEFPGGTVYTNIIAPYWGLHTMDISKTAGTYHYLTEDEAVVSFMEYGNSMNIGVCYQLIMKKDGSFKFQYKGYGDYAIIYGIFGLAGISNEDGSEGIRLPERYVVFNKAVQFTPVVESTIAPNESKTVDLSVLTNRMAGTYTSALQVNTNVPHSEKVEIPINLTITGSPIPSFPTDSIIIERVVGHFDDPSAGPVTAMGANYEAYFKVKNEGTAPFYVLSVENGGPSIYDEYFDEYYPIFSTFWNAPETDWMTGELTGNYIWTQYYGESFEVGERAAEFSIPMMYDYANTIGTYDVPMTFTYTTDVTNPDATKVAVVNIRFIVTPAPVITLDREDIHVTNAASNYVGNETLKISNNGEYKLTYELRLDPTGEGETVEDPGYGGGVAPATAKSNAIVPADAIAEAETELASVTPLETGTNALNTPTDFEYRRALYYPAAANPSVYKYGTNNTYSQYVSATYFEAPEDGFNISHIYTALNIYPVENTELIVEIVKGDNPAGEVVLGQGTLQLAKQENQNEGMFVAVPLDKAVYMNGGQSFYVRITYPLGVTHPAYLISKEEAVISNRYMGAVAGSSSWTDIGTFFNDQVGSVGYIVSCLEVNEGAAWVKMLNETTSGEIAAGESLDVNFEIRAEYAPLEKDNRAMLIIKSSDPNNSLINFPIILDLNGKPEITAPESTIYAKENSTTVETIGIVEPDGDTFTIRLDDPDGIATIQSVNATAGEQPTITTNDDKSVTVSGAVAGVEVLVDITPDYGTAGAHYFTISAADTDAHEASATVKYEVEHVNRAPVAVESAEDVQIAVGTSSDIISFADLFSDPDGDKLTYAISLNKMAIATCFTTNNSVIFYGDSEGTVKATVTATDTSGATASISFDVIVSKYDGVEDITIATGVKVYPNPVVESLYVICSFDAEDATYSIYDADGSLLYQAEEAIKSNEAKYIHVGNLPAGIYFVKVVADGKVATLPFVKE